MSTLRSSEIKWFAQSHSVLMADAEQTQTSSDGLLQSASNTLL